MAAAEDGRIACPACGKSYRWKVELAGRKVACRCGATMRMPTGPEGQAAADPAPGKGKPAGSNIKSKLDPPHEDNGGAYELNLDDPEPAKPAHAPAPPAEAGGGGGAAAGGKCPSCNKPVKPGAVICINCGFNLKSGTKIQTKVGEVEEGHPPTAVNSPAAPPPKLGGTLATAGSKSAVALAIEERVDEKDNKLTDLYAPIALIILGVGLTFISKTSLSGETDAMSFAGAAVQVFVEAILIIPLMLMGLFIAARIASISYGSLSTGLLKLVAIAFAPGAIADISWYMTNLVDDTGFIGIFVWIIVAIALYWGLIAWLFSLDFMETMVTIGVIFVVRNILIGFIIGTLWAFFG